MSPYAIIIVYLVVFGLSIVLGITISKFAFQQPIMSTTTLVLCVAIFAISRRLLVPQIKEMLWPGITERQAQSAISMPSQPSVLVSAQNNDSISLISPVT